MSNVNNRKDLLRNKARMWIFDEAATVKDWFEMTLMDNIKVMNPTNPVEIKSPSGQTVFKTLDLDCVISGDWYHPGNLTAIERMYRGVVDLTTHSGSAVTEAVAVAFRQNNEAFPLPGFDGDKSVVTINNVKTEDLATTYTVTTDYTVAVDATTGISHLVHVSTGSIPLNTKVIVNYDYTPLAGKILKPNYDNSLVFRHIMLDVFPNPSDLTKYRRYYMPNCTIETEIGHSLLEIGADNTSPNILPVTFKYAKPDYLSSDPKWYYIDTYNV
jgi:hypothetical protein